MAFNGLHVSCSRAGANGDTVAVPQKPIWSQTFTAAGTTDFATPPETEWLSIPGGGEPIINLVARGGAWWATIGPSAPDAQTPAPMPDDPALPTTTRLFVADGADLSVAASRWSRIRVAPVA